MYSTMMSGMWPRAALILLLPMVSCIFWSLLLHVKNATRGVYAL